MDSTTGAPARAPQGTSCDEGDAGPAWVGIGAQRSGTTWFTDLLCTHPDVGLARQGRKETHFFDRFLCDAWTERDRAAYRALFPRARAPGEFTPAYLRSVWVAPLLRDACSAETRLIVVLRDPIDRFRSAMRWAASRGLAPPRSELPEFRRWVRRAGNQAIWAGMYATQLHGWLGHFARARIHVIQYESVVADAARPVLEVWRALGLDPAPVGRALARTWNSTKAATWYEPPGVVDMLRRTYAGNVDRLCAEWGIDRRMWPNFA